MMSLKDRKLSRLWGVSLIVMAIAFVMAVTGEGYGTSSSPTISTDPGTAPGMSLTISGRNFTPNRTAVLYSINNESYIANVDKTGNTSWTYTNVFIVPYPIYALDVSTNNKSNTITIMPQLNDFTPTPPPTPTPFPGNLFAVLSICIATLIYILKKRSPPPTK
jgi:hypothetical protein